MSFAHIDAILAILANLPGRDPTACAGAEARNAQLTKPPGALGRLEEIAIWYAGWRGDARPRLAAPQVVIFAGNHGVAARGVSAFPAEVTVQMVANFQAGGAAINQLCRAFGAKMSVVPLELDRPTSDFTQGPAMDERDFLSAFNAGWAAVDAGADLLVVGEMGIGNTTSAAALAHGLWGGTPADWVGRGTGVDEEGLALKVQVVAQGIAANAALCGTPLGALRALGGRELVAMAGAILRARTLRVPVILDGFICTAAASTLQAAAPGALDHCIAGHVSQEPGHARLLGRLGKAPLLALDLRLGEGSGAALAIGVLQGAIACHSGMSTFAEAGVSGG
jgi:nicotinate-nucleotide--dimethylbenzimidazole phosphoribosyltransferase